METTVRSSTDVGKGSASDKASEDALSGVNDPDRSHIILFLRERTWDFMPPDVVRPLASIRMHSLVVLALRLGMSWRDPKLASEKMQADGNGFSLSATTIRGLGLVFQFATSGGDDQSAQSPHLIASVAADKLMCGIIPGCPRLVKRDFRLVGDDCVISLLHNLLDVLSLNKETRSALQDHKYRRPHPWRDDKHKRSVLNDAMVLLMPFLPLKGTTVVYAQFSGWLGQSGTNMWHFWESRRALVVQLTSRLKVEQSEIMKKVLQELEKLEDDYKLDFYSTGNPNTSARIFAEFDPNVKCGPEHEKMVSRLEDKKGMLNHLRDRHDATTGFFEERASYGTQGMPEEDVVSSKAPNRFFLDLLGAHVNMGVRAGEKARLRGGDPKNHPRAPVDYAKGKPWDGWREVYEQGWAYVEFLPGLVDEMIDKRGYKTLSRLEVEGAWWMLVLRGIAWEMSVLFRSPPEMVPSSFYGNQTPVWLM